ncbi:MAG: hypothetical protein GQ532_14345 [Methylomarinum sp.]|nr:hypothetical protein [Methylomarinum sp.]
MTIKPNWGGKRKGSGRKKGESSKKTVVIRVDESLLPFIKILKERLKAGQEIESLLNVTNNQDVALQAKTKELEKFKEVNLDLVLQKDAEHSKVIALQTKIRGLQSKNNDLKAHSETLEHKEHDCMVLKKDGSRCTRPAKIKINWHGVEIKACLQHGKTQL